MWLPIFVQPIAAFFEHATALGRAAPLTQELARRGLHSPRMIPESLSRIYHFFGTQNQKIQIKLALIVDTNFIVELDSRNDGIGREDNLQLG